MIERVSYVQKRKPMIVRVGKSKAHKSYSYFRPGGKTRVQATLIANLGKPGKGPKVIPVTRPGMLSAYGYSASKTPLARHRALTKAITQGAQKPLSVFHRLQAVATLSKRTMPTYARTYRYDRNYIGRKFLGPK
jgi:hypothetical protein